VSELAPVLAGCRVLVTAQRRAGELGSALARRGAEVVQAPTLGVLPHVDETTLIARTKDLLVTPPDTLVVTTGIGFRGWLDAAEAAGLADDLLAVLDEVRLVARGPKARGALQAAGLTADWVAESETSAEITDFLLSEGLSGTRLAIQHHGAGDTGMDGAFVDAGADVVPLEVYRWGPPEDPHAVLRAAEELGAGCFDAVLFTSAPGAVAWLESLRRARTTDRVRERVQANELLLAAVGPVTAEPLAFAGMIAQVPTRARMGGLVRLVIQVLGDDRQALLTMQGRLRVRAGTITLDHRPVQLSPSGLAVLRRLAATPGHVVTREELLRVLPGESTEPHTAEVAVARLREALRGATGESRLVRTVIKRGYVLAAH
jgi:uroporphyrinogen-III synthase